MTTATQDPSSVFHAGLLNLRRVKPWWFAAPGLILAMIFYCELHGAVVGRPAPGLAVSVPWALQMSVGWIVAAAALQRWMPRLAASEFGSRWPRSMIGAAVVAITAFTLLCELILTARWPELPAFLYSRAPMHAIVAIMLVGLRTRPGPAQPAHAVTDGAAKAVPTPTLEVMTGTGRTEIRVADIESLSAEGNYISVAHVSGRTYLLRQTMAATEQMLEAQGFVRIHRSIIVNRDRIRERRSGSTLMLESGRSVKVSRAFSARLANSERKPN